MGYLLEDRGIGARFPAAEIFLLSTAPNTTEYPWRHVYWLVDSELRLRTANCNTGPFLLLHFADHRHLTTVQQTGQAARHPDIVTLLASERIR